VRWIWIATLGAAAAAVAVVLVVARTGGPSAAAPTGGGTRATLDRTIVEFGDPVTATVSVTAPRGTDVHVDPDLSPLTQLGAARVTRVTSGGALTVTYATRASCLDHRCIARRGAKRITPQPARVTVAGKTTSVSWPALQVDPRVSPADAAKTSPPLRGDASPPAVTYATSPPTLATVLDVVAAVLAAAGVLVAGAAAAGLYRRHRRAPQLTGLERALALAREAEERPAEDRRRALGLLARLLGPRDERLADEADELAWSAPAPTPGALAELVSQVEQKVHRT
jgi:hypothetical protein